MSECSHNPMTADKAKAGVQVIHHCGTNQEERGAICEVLDNNKVKVAVNDKASGTLSHYASWDLKDLEVAPTEGMQKKFGKGFKKTASDTSGGMTGGATGTEQ